jgi:protein involved in polysaccharide export with SLBB domain
MSMEWNPATMKAKLLKSTKRILERLGKSVCIPGLLMVAGMATGCTSLTQPLTGVPVRRLPPQLLAQSKANLVPLDPVRLKQEEPRQYLIDKGDILGIYIQGILPYADSNKPPEPPPVNFPDKDSTLDPSIGFPIPVLEDGTIALPSIEPVKVRGMTISQIRNVIRKAYIDAKIVKDASLLQPSVTLVKERTVSVVVVRQDTSVMNAGILQQAQFGRGNFTRGSDQSSAGKTIQLPAYQNDVLHALMESGGLPGLNAKNEVRVLKADRLKQKERDDFIQQFYQTYYCNPNPCSCPPPLPDDPSVIKIPMRLPPGVLPTFAPEDIILEDGDVIYIESREAEVFYTGGLLPGGEFLVPRDYDLDVLGAMAMAGRGVSAPGQQGGGGIGIGSLGGVSPSQLFILRKTPCNGQITIEVDLAKAAQDPRERPLVMPGDTLILRYKPCEEALNFGIGTFFTFGIQAAFQGLFN